MFQLAVQNVVTFPVFLDERFDMNTYMLPVMNPFTKEWIIDNKDGTFSTLSSEEYEHWRKENVKTVYDGANTGLLYLDK